MAALAPEVKFREVWAWSMYDFANSAYTTVVVTAVFGAYFVGVVAEGKPWAKAGELTGMQFASKTETPFVVVTFPGGHQFPVEAPGLITKFFKEHAKK